MSEIRREPVNPDESSCEDAATDESESETEGRTESGSLPLGAMPARLRRPARGRRLVKKEDDAALTLTPEQRLLLLDTWRRSGLPARDFGALVGVSRHTLYAWKHKFDSEGPAGLETKPRGGPKGSRLPEVTKRAILMLKQDIDRPLPFHFTTCTQLSHCRCALAYDRAINRSVLSVVLVTTGSPRSMALPAIPPLFVLSGVFA